MSYCNAQKLYASIKHSLRDNTTTAKVSFAVNWCCLWLRKQTNKNL